MLRDTMKQAIKELPAILSTREVMDFFCISYMTVFRLIHRGELAAYEDEEGNWCIIRSELEKFCSKNCNL